MDYLYIDIIPQNIYLEDQDFVSIDQEWVFENAPYEYLLYRAIHYSVRKFDNSNVKKQKYLKMFELEKYSKYFEELESKFFAEIAQKNMILNKYRSFDYITSLIANKTNSVNELTKQVEELKQEVQILKEQIKKDDNES